MTQSLTDQYHLEQPSPSTAPGFSVFQNETSERWFFHCNDAIGTPLLFSQAYRDEETARRGLRAVLDNLQKKRISIKGESGQYYCVVTAGNHQEIARSRFFSQRSEAENSQSYLLHVAQARFPEAETAKAATRPSRPPRATQRPILSAENIGTIPRIRTENGMLAAEGVFAMTAKGPLEVVFDNEKPSAEAAAIEFYSLTLQNMEADKVAVHIAAKPFLDAQGYYGLAFDASAVASTGPHLLRASILLKLPHNNPGTRLSGTTWVYLV
jgi:hypothetical protein